MRLLLDEMLDQRLTSHFASHGHECVSAEAAGLKGLLNGELLAAAELRGFEALVTVDKSIEYQTNLADRKIAILIVRVFKNKLLFVLPYVPDALRALESIKPGEVKYVGEPRLIAKNIES
jgi:predicted nuclease of predicted toxin-antitoxin system